MFSEGTFRRYLFEIAATHEKLASLYRHLAEHAGDEQTRNTARTFLKELEDEARSISAIHASFGKTAAAPPARRG